MKNYYTFYGKVKTLKCTFLLDLGYAKENWVIIFSKILRHLEYNKTEMSCSFERLAFLGCNAFIY